MPQNNRQSTLRADNYEQSASWNRTGLACKTSHTPYISCIMQWVAQIRGCNSHILAHGCSQNALNHNKHRTHRNTLIGAGDVQATACSDAA